MTTALAIFGSVAVVLGFITAVLGLLNQRKIKNTAGKVQEISVNVDGRLSAMIERQAQLLSALHGSGTPVPPVPADATRAEKHL
jgi:hypothetical protein